MGKVVTACDLRFDGKEPLLQLALMGEINNISIPFDPTSFKDDLPRKGISFNIPETARLQIERIEERVKTLLCATWPETQWHSARPQTLRPLPNVPPLQNSGEGTSSLQVLQRAGEPKGVA